MNKEKIAARVSEKTGMNKNEARKLIDVFVDVMVEGLKEDGEIRLVNFGVIRAVVSKAKQIHSKIAGGMISVPERVVVKFKASKTLNKIVDESRNK